MIQLSLNRTLDDMERDASDQVSLEYAADVDHHLAVMEQKTLCDSNMMDLQPELEWNMRPYLMDFLVESHQGLKLNTETLFLATNIIDRYASKRVIYQRHYQLVGCSALWISSKYCDKKHKVPTLKELRTLCCNAYDSHMFVQMESHILNTLGWAIGHPTCDIFVDRFLEASRCGADVDIWRQVSLYLCETSIFHRSMLHYTASTIASASVQLAAVITNNAYGYHQGFHQDCFNQLAHLIQLPSLPNSVDRKYSRRDKMYAFNLVQSFLSATAAAAAAAVSAAAPGCGSNKTAPITSATAATNNSSPCGYTCGKAVPNYSTPALRTITPPLQPNEFAYHHYCHHPTTPVQQQHQQQQPGVSTYNGYVTPPFTPNLHS